MEATNISVKRKKRAAWSVFVILKPNFAGVLLSRQPGNTESSPFGPRDTLPNSRMADAITDDYDRLSSFMYDITAFVSDSACSCQILIDT